MNIDPVELLELLQLTSPSLPVGGYSWSQGLESAIELQWLKGEHDLIDWLQGILSQGFVYQEWPLLIRLYTSMINGQQEQVAHWNALSLALRETSELRQEDLQMGAALLKLMNDLDYSGVRFWVEPEISYVTAFAFAASEKGIKLDAACIGFSWSWLENQISVALKTFPLGQTAGQRVFHALSNKIPDFISKAKDVSDESIGISLPGIVFASTKHEKQYSRLFRS